ncbi:MAG: SDR family NAD(P)-dependent oxidoreductase [Planctomycetota bacterium]|nr:SDR family NAD(P)-dependent oxidoreductase [Planctomycetota bacterium]
MKALVTGATGFVGSHLVRRLIADGWRVVATKRRRSSLEHLPASQIDFVEWDVSSEPSEELEKALAEVDIVFHLAGVIKSLNKDDFYRINFEGTRLLYGMASKHGNIKRFVFFSSQAAAGPSPTVEGIDESAPCKPVCHYGRSKMLAEIFLAAKEACPFTIIRPPVVFGEKDPATGELFRAVAKGWRFRIAGFLKAISLVYVEDLVEGVISAATAEIAKGRTYFFCYDEPVSLDGFFDLIEDAFDGMADGKKRLVRRLTVTAAEVKFFAALAHLFGSVFGFVPSLNLYKLPHFAQRFWTIRCDRAKRELNFKPSFSIAESIRRTLQSYLDFKKRTNSSL